MKINFLLEDGWVPDQEPIILGSKKAQWHDCINYKFIKKKYREKNRGERWILERI